jgi:hypothetical protein
VSNEIKVNLQMPIIIGHSRCRYSTGCNVKCSIPPMIYRWRKGKPDFTNDLGPPM